MHANRFKIGIGNPALMATTHLQRPLNFPGWVQNTLNDEKASTCDIIIRCVDCKQGVTTKLPKALLLMATKYCMPSMADASSTTKDTRYDA